VHDKSGVESGVGENYKGEMAIGGPIPRRNLAFVFFLGSLSGFGFLLYLALLPSDVEGRILGPYSAARLLLMAGPLIGAIVMFALGVKTVRDHDWGSRAAFLVYGRKASVPRILIVAALAAVSGIAGVSLYWPQLLLGLTKYHVARLVPYYAWPVVILALLGAAWLAVWSGKRLRFSSAIWELSAASLLFLVSLSVRYPLTGFGLPYTAVSDEVITYTRALSLIAGPLSAPVASVPGYGRASYGQLLIHTAAAGQVAGLLGGLRSQQVSSIAEFTAPPAGVSSIYEGVHRSGLPLRSPRILLALINSTAPALVFIALRRYLKTGLWASFAGGLIYAVFSREVVYYSSFVLPDALGTTFSLGAFLAAMAAIGDRTGKRAPYLLCGMFVGLAVSVTIRYASMAIVPFLAVGLARDRTKLMTKLGLALVGILGAFVLTSPRALTDPASYLSGMTSLVWRSDPSVENRLESLVFYVQSMFGSGAGSSGPGLITLLLALIGLGRLLASRPRHALLFALFAGVHILLVTPIIERYGRHVLVLYPIACVLAGIGLDASAGAINAFLAGREGSLKLPTWAKRWRSLGRARGWSGAALVAVGFLLLSVSQVRTTVGYVKAIANAETTQVSMARYLEQSLQPGELVGILDLIPWVEADLHARRIDFERIGLRTTLAELRRRGITHVVGSDAIEGEYGSISGTIWDTAFDAPGDRLAEFGRERLWYRGRPMASLYMFAARVPPVDPILGGE